MRLLIALFALILAFSASAHVDTIYTYFDINKKITQPDGAAYISKIVKERNIWRRQVFIKSSGQIYIDGYFADEKTHIPEGCIKHYQDSGKLSDSCFFVNGQLTSKYTFYSNGQVKSYILFADNENITDQGGYTPNGNKIEHYLVWRPAMYPDNTDGWQKYLKRKASSHLPRGI